MCDQKLCIFCQIKQGKTETLCSASTFKENEEKNFKLPEKKNYLKENCSSENQVSTYSRI